VIQDFENYYLVYTTSLTAATQDVTVTSARRAAPVVISARTIDNYASGATAVPAAGAGTIALAAADVAANPTSTVMIEGFSDSRGSAAGNLTSSRRRAERARAALVTAGVGAGQIRIEPRGATNFVAPNNNSANRALNRRVVITVRRPGP
jgi:outer membrane protein OmpA-like peptidoglycan-associated protein